jgi:hypothetical protein
MKTKIYTILVAFGMLIMANQINAQAVAESNALTTTTTEMDLKAAIPTLSNFLADVTENAIKISWAVKNEPVNSVYYIEKSIDDETYVVIDTVEAKYNESKVNLYSFVDPEPSDKTAYYSVRKKKKKGTLYSKLLSVEKVSAKKAE